ncbi:MAG: leucine aminopeptidase [Gemmatimonadetes bacterium]|nr:leucine aminopeptidase [Gemmatimonadota bacterium]
MRKNHLLLIAVTATLACTTRTISTSTDIVPSASGLAVIPAGTGWLGDPRIGLARDVALQAALADVSPARLRATDSALVSFGTRNTFSDTLSTTRGVGAARRWLFAQLQQASRDCGGCLRVEYDAAVIKVARHPQGASANIVNVLGILPGRDTNRVVVMGGHYDSCVCSVPPNGGVDSTSTAPGADDDGSGTSAVVELARVISKRYPKGLDATVIFVLHAAEEQGLLGATHLAQRLKAEGKQVVAGMTDDIIGNVIAEDGTVDSTSVRVYATDPDSSSSRELGRYVWGLGALYLPGFEVVPVFRLDRIGRGGDHTPYVQAGWPGLRFTERLENYKRQHLPTDDLEHVNFGYIAQVARLNAVTVVSLASAPALPDAVIARRENAASGGQAWSLRWTPVVGATRYEILVRRTTSPSWDRVIPVSGGLTQQLDFQLDDGWAAVRAVGANGHRSLARVAGPAPRPAAATPARP